MAISQRVSTVSGGQTQAQRIAEHPAAEHVHGSTIVPGSAPVGMRLGSIGSQLLSSALLAVIMITVSAWRSAHTTGDSPRPCASEVVRFRATRLHSNVCSRSERSSGLAFDGNGYCRAGSRQCILAALPDTSRSNHEEVKLLRAQRGPQESVAFLAFVTESWHSPRTPNCCGCPNTATQNAASETT